MHDKFSADVVCVCMYSTCDVFGKHLKFLFALSVRWKILKCGLVCYKYEGLLLAVFRPKCFQKQLICLIRLFWKFMTHFWYVNSE